jgi:ABC-2 type transport system ATP-binding protein
MEAIKLFSKWNKTKIDSSLLEALNIKDIEKNQYNQMSVGQKRRLHLALALVSNPDIIFLDEPTAGLDVEGRFALHQELRKLKKQGKTIVLASHDMAEVESLCDRIAILNEGKIAFCGTAAELSEKIGKKYFIQIKTIQGSHSSKPQSSPRIIQATMLPIRTSQHQACAKPLILPPIFSNILYPPFYLFRFTCTAK